ncbi:MAG: tRNA preQ1(34) S-adenosylmethionine ribosyltransferase-isomerase QueA [Acidobacteria bacterium]|nr:tRNA preQ1(34) S-adenosylmethionine ribosyltransferase-isomerase QueA [Acidobacteriota bacterium]
MLVSEFDFDLPPELIAQEPPAERGASRLLRLGREDGAISHHRFSDLPDLLAPGDLLVVNDTRVFPARLIGRRLPGGGAAECFLVRPGAEPDTWVALVHPGQRLKPGSRMVFEREGHRIDAEVISQHYHGRRLVRLQSPGGTRVWDAIHAVGHMPLPPYVRREDTPADRERYQTVYARAEGSIAAPTAGLHFTGAIFDALRQRGIERATITLHVGYGTFQPVRVEDVSDHRVEAEHFEVSAEAATALTRARAEGRRIVAVGTTTTRTLESLELDGDSSVQPQSGETALFIRPGHAFRLVSGLITNFHLPRSSLLMLVAAFAGRERVLAAYREAIAARYRFYSYGDAMLIL